MFVGRINKATTLCLITGIDNVNNNGQGGKPSEKFYIFLS